MQCTSYRRYRILLWCSRARSLACSSDIDFPVKNDNPKRCVLNYKMAKWEQISIQLESITLENMNSMITEAPTKSLLTFRGLVRGVCQNSIPRKTLCEYSKPFWSNKLINLSKKVKEARKKYRPQCNTKNRTWLKWLKSNSKRK